MSGITFFLRIGGSRGVHSVDRVGSGRVLFGSIVFRIGYFSDACYDG